MYWESLSFVGWEWATAGLLCITSNWSESLTRGQRDVFHGPAEHWPVALPGVETVEERQGKVSITGLELKGVCNRDPVSALWEIGLGSPASLLSNKPVREGTILEKLRNLRGGGVSVNIEWDKDAWSWLNIYLTEILLKYEWLEYHKIATLNFPLSSRHETPKSELDSIKETEF